MDIAKNQSWSGRKRLTLFGVCVAAIMLPLDITIVGVALDSIGRDLNASFAGLQWVITGYNMTFGSLLLTAGSLADLFGRRRLFAFGIALFTIFSLLCGFSQNLLMLNCFRVLQGVGSAFVLTSGTAVLANEFRHGSERAKAFGALGSAFGIGLALGPLIGGVLNSGLGWRWIFWVNLPVGLSVLALAVPKMAESKDPGATRIDWAGLVTFTLSLFLLIYALNSGPEAGWGSPRIIGALLGTSILIAIFITAERSQRRPMFDLSLFRKPSFVAAQILPVAVGFGFVALLVYLPLYFQGVKGYSPLQAGLGMMPLTVPILFVPILAGRLAARIPVRIMLTAGLVLIGLGALWMSGIKSDPRALAIGLGITGIGTGITFGLMDNLAVSVVPADRSGMAAGIFSTMRIAGEMIAIALMVQSD